MMELVKLILICVCLVCLVILLSGLFRADRVELKKARWRSYPKHNPSKVRAFKAEKTVKLLVSMKDGNVDINYFDMDKKIFESFDEKIDGWRELPLSYRNNFKMLSKIKEMLGRNK